MKLYFSSILTNQYVYSFQLLAVAVFVGVVSLSLQMTCPQFRQKPQKTLKRLRKHFLFVEKPSVTGLQSPTMSPRRVSRDVTMQTPGTTLCPWSWGQDDNPERVPRFISKAVCSDCAHYCRSVLYYHRGLVQRCDVSTGQTVWKWTLVELPVAFVYDP